LRAIVAHRFAASIISITCLSPILAKHDLLAVILLLLPLILIVFVILLVVVPVHLLRVLQLTLPSFHRLVQHSDVIHINVIVYTMM